MPTRMSTRAKSSQDSDTAADSAESGEDGARVVVLEDLRRVVAEVGHRLRAPLVEPDAVAVPAAREAHDRPVDGDREQRALQRVVADELAEIVAPERRRALE